MTWPLEMKVGEGRDGAGEELEELMGMLGPRDRDKMERLASVRSWQVVLDICSLASFPAGDQPWQGLAGGL